jgi:hypothetical protein
MKREYVIPDLLASLTADALFSGSPRRFASDSAPASGPSVLQRMRQWFKRAPQAAANSLPKTAVRDTLTDDWAGGWYARTRLLQATTLANHAANSGATTGQNAGLDASAVDAKAAS